MPINIVSTSVTGLTLTPQVSGDTLLLMPGVEVISTFAGQTALPMSGSSQAVIMGLLASNGRAILLDGAGVTSSRIEVTTSGRVISAAPNTSSIVLDGSGGRLVSAGEIIALGGSAVETDFQSGAAQVVNSGRISARDAGIFGAPSSALLTVTNSGAITGGTIGISAERPAHIVNTGNVAGVSVGVGLLGGSRDSRLANAGEISGNVAIVVQHNDAVITNTGTLIGQEAALRVDATIVSGRNVTFNNHGAVMGDVLMGRDGNTLLNLGEITGRADFSAGTLTSGTITTSLVNAGTIGFASNLGLNAAGVVLGGVLRDMVENSGLILGSVQLGGGSDVYAGAAGRVSGAVDGQAGDDLLTGGRDDDVLLGGEGDDILRGMAGDDLLDGGDGFDFLIGGLGDDTLLASSGDDTLVGGAGADRLNGDVGIDLADYRHSAAGVTIDLALGLASGGDAAGDELVFIENLRGSALDDLLLGSDVGNSFFGGGGQDTLRGLAGNDTLNGEAGQDLLEGGLGNDVLSGGDGEDTLVGGAGVDVLRGGTGADLFRYLSIEDSLVPTRDAIIDFSQAQGDRMDLSAIDAVVGGADDAFVFIGTAAFTNAATGQIRATASGANTIIDVDLGNDGNALADLRIILAGVFTLTAADFLL